METKELLRKHFDALRAKKDALDKQTAPIYAKRDALWQKVHKLREEIEAVTQDIRAIENADYIALTREIAQVAKALGGKAMSDNRT